MAIQYNPSPLVRMRVRAPAVLKVFIVSDATGATGERVKAALAQFAEARVKSFVGRTSDRAGQVVEEEAAARSLLLHTLVSNGSPRNHARTGPAPAPVRPSTCLARYWAASPGSSD